MVMHINTVVFCAHWIVSQSVQKYSGTDRNYQKNAFRHKLWKIEHFRTQFYPSDVICSIMRNVSIGVHSAKSVVLSHPPTFPAYLLGTMLKWHSAERTALKGGAEITCQPVYLSVHLSLCCLSTSLPPRSTPHYLSSAPYVSRKLSGQLSDRSFTAGFYVIVNNSR